MNQFLNKTAVITGGASGLGLALGKALVAAGANVMLADIDALALERALTGFGANSARVRAVVCDVADAASVQRAADATLQTFGPTHLLCNNAGVAVHDAVETTSARDWRWVLDVDLMGVVNGIQAFLPQMRAHGEPAHILNTASILGLLALPRNGAYNAAKFAVIGVSECLEAELQDSKIGVSVLLPGWVRTNIMGCWRHRPADAPPLPPVSARDAQELKEKARLIARGLHPDRVAARVLEGLRAKEFYIFTHDSHASEVKRRFDRILGALDAVAQSPALHVASIDPH